MRPLSEGAPGACASDGAASSRLPEAVRAVCESFANVHRLGVLVFAGDGTPWAEIRRGSEGLDLYIESFPQGAAELRATREAILEAPVRDGEAVRLPCFTGSRYLVRPIGPGGALGRVVLGPYLPEEAHGVQELAGLGEELDHAQTETLLARIRRLSEATAEALAVHLEIVVSALISEGSDRGGLLDRGARFIGPLSHELRTPLTAIMGYTDMILEGLCGEISPEQREGLATVLDRSQALLLTLNSLLDLLAASAGKLPLLRAPASPGEIAKDALEEVGPEALRRGIALCAEIEPGLPHVLLDESRIRQSLVQLLGNGIKFNRPGGEVVLSARQVRSNGLPFLEFAVTDRGIGLAPEQQARIFEPFYQVDASPTRPYGGIGLGLTLVHAHALAHGGKVLVQSLPGEGSRFALLLPIGAEKVA